MSSDDTESPLSRSEVQAIKAAVDERIDQRIDDLPAGVSRRDALKMAGLVGGGALLGGAGAGSASAGLSSGGDPISVGQKLDVDDSYHIAGNLYAGPASARPASADGRAIWLVTDAGANFLTEQTYYDGSSWQTLGVQAGSVSTEDATINGQSVEPSMHSPHRDAPTGEVALGRDELRHSPAVAGNLTQGDEKRMHFEIGDKTVTSSTWTEIRPPIGYQSLNIPPNKVPVLRAFADFASDTAGESTEIAIGPHTLGAAGAPIHFQSFAATGDNRHYAEVYLHEVDDATAIRDNTFPLRNAQYRVWARATGTSTGTIHPESNLIFEWEVV